MHANVDKIIAFAAAARLWTGVANKVLSAVIAKAPPPLRVRLRLRLMRDDFVVFIRSGGSNCLVLLLEDVLTTIFSAVAAEAK